MQNAQESFINSGTFTAVTVYNFSRNLECSTGWMMFVFVSWSPSATRRVSAINFGIHSGFEERDSESETGSGGRRHVICLAAT